MLSFFRGIIDRLKALFVTDAVLDLEAHMLSRDAERRADLLRQAAEYEREGLHDVAQELRHQAQAVHFQRPLASILPALGHVQEKQLDEPVKLLPPANNNQEPQANGDKPKALPAPTRKARKS